MNKTKFDLTGGNFMELDDFEFEQRGIREGFEGLLSFFQDVTLAADGFIISGCDAVLATGDFTIQPGFIAFKGEVYKVDLQVIADDAGKTFFWDEVITFDPAGTEDFEDSSTQETYEIRRVKLFSATVPPGDIMPFDRLNPSDPSLTQEKLVIRQQFSEGINTTGIGILTKVIDIGGWNMDTDDQRFIAHGLPDTKKIRSIDVVIQSDTGGIFKIEAISAGGFLGGGVEAVNVNDVVLRRIVAGQFDSVAFDDNGINRGWVTIGFIL